MTNKAKIAVEHSGAAQRFARWVQDPMGSIIAASIAAMGSLGVVMSGIWFVNLAVG